VKIFYTPNNGGKETTTQIKENQQKEKLNSNKLNLNSNLVAYKSIFQLKINPYSNLPARLDFFSSNYSVEEVRIILSVGIKYSLRFSKL